MIKPSERIKEIMLHSQMKFDTPTGSTTAEAIALRAEKIMNAVVEYLDEEYEKDKQLRNQTHFTAK